MANDGRNDGRIDRRNNDSFSDLEWLDLDKAAVRLARAFGFGPSWRLPTIDFFGNDTEDQFDTASMLPIRTRGAVLEQAAHAVDGSSHCRREHTWPKARGIVSIPFGSPDPIGQAASSYARLSGPLWPLLQTFALLDIAAWLIVEPFLHAELRASHDHKYFAGRDAMTRIMYGSRGRLLMAGVHEPMCACVPIDERAKQLWTTPKRYGREVREAQYILCHWLITAARAYNAAANAGSTQLGRSQGRGQRTETWWHPKRPFIAREKAKPKMNIDRPRYLKAA